MRHLVISGGPLHDFAATTGALVAVADGEGLSSTVPEDPTEALDRLVEDPGWDVVTVNALLWSMGGDRYDHLREQWAHEVRSDHLEAIHRHVHGGGGLLALHTAPICFDGDPRWTALLGASWAWGRSWHPPLGPVEVRRVAAEVAHPVTADVAGFTVVDEVYCDLDLASEIEPHLTVEVDGVARPVLWSRVVGRGRVVVDLLGHHEASIALPAHSDVLRRALRWLTPVDRPLGTTPTPREVHR